ncbi:MAG: hypothetical protein MPN21_03680 [Thermoanaerobaculia bacterium]|nr:hypothetical protein [Thermoanaerobaculia bacterium]
MPGHHSHSSGSKSPEPSTTPQTLDARVIPTPEGSRLETSDFVELGDTPGDVAICLSGGGSRALTAGMGQMRALRALTSADRDLVSLARALSTVSGGSWLGTTWTYLPSSTPDDDYLNRFVADPGRLVPTKTQDHSMAETLDELPEGNIGLAIAARSFAPAGLALKALMLHLFGGVPAHSVWQTLVGIHLLEPYGLYEGGEDAAPTSLFSYDEAVLQRDVLAPNPSLTGETAHLVTANDPEHSRRPYLVCNTSMFLQRTNQAFQLLAPVQCTPFWSGIVSHPDGADANGRQAGGGGLTCFAFNCSLLAISGRDASVGQSRQWSLTDAVGSSSAFFAEVLQNLFTQWHDDPSQLVAAALEHREETRAMARRHLKASAAHRVLHRLEDEALEPFRDAKAHLAPLVGDFLGVIGDLKDLIPEYFYWPVQGASPEPDLKATRFADGGNLENTGVANALSYDDVDRVLAFVNSSEPLMTGARGVMVPDGSGGTTEAPGTRIVVSAQIPPLFGYQPYDKDKGYVLYAGDEDPEKPVYAHSHVFESSGFVEFLTGLWKAMGNTVDPEDLGPGKPGVKQSTPRVRQTLRVVDNTWFHVHGTRADGSQRQIEILWFYLDRVRDWYDQLQPEVQAILGDFDDPNSYSGFPNYSTFKTHLTATELNLMAHLTAWCVAGEPNAEGTEAMFG